MALRAFQSRSAMYVDQERPIGGMQCATAARRCGARDENYHRHPADLLKLNQTAMR
jgi:hypothetical protein